MGVGWHWEVSLRFPWGLRGCGVLPPFSSRPTLGVKDRIFSIRKATKNQWVYQQPMKKGCILGCPSPKVLLMEETRLTSRYGKCAIIYRVLYIPSGAGFLPSTVKQWQINVLVEIPKPKNIMSSWWRLESWFRGGGQPKVYKPCWIAKN